MNEDFLSILMKIRADMKGGVGKWTIPTASRGCPEFWEWLARGEKKFMEFEYISPTEEILLTKYRQQFIAWYRLQR